MKAALNGVPNFSVLDGWWVEGCLEGVNGWAIGADRGDGSDGAHAAAFYEKLENTLLPLFHGDRSGWCAVMKQAIATSGWQFSATACSFSMREDAYDFSAEGVATSAVA